MSPDTPVFVQTDWSQLETWLTAHFSGDETLQRELNESLDGGHKVHALNAHEIYGCDPGDAKTYEVVLQGQPHPAYDAGKRIGHLFNYGGEAGVIADTFWLSRKFAEEIYGKLAAKYDGVMRWREELADATFGVGSYLCPRCRRVDATYGPCGVCSRPQVAVMKKWQAWSVEPQRQVRTPFGRRRLMLGRRKDGRKKAAAQGPQSSGISMWYRTLQRANGFVTHMGERIDQPTPNVPYRVVGGTYDSFLTETTYGAMGEVAAFMTYCMERKWPQLGGKRFPAEAEWGEDWGKMHDIERQAFEEWAA